MLNRTIPATVALCILSGPLGAADDKPTLGDGRGQMYPDFLMAKIDGSHGRLSDYRGKKVVLLHFASW